MSTNLIRTLVGDLVERVADCYPHLLRLARHSSRLDGLLAHLPWLGSLHLRHPRLAALAVYWAATILPTLLIVVLQGSSDLLAALRAGAWLWLLQAVLWLVLDAVLFGPVFLPLWLGCLEPVRMVARGEPGLENPHPLRGRAKNRQLQKRNEHQPLLRPPHELW